MNVDSRVFCRDRLPGAGEAQTCWNRMLVQLQPEAELLAATLVSFPQQERICLRGGGEHPTVKAPP